MGPLWLCLAMVLMSCAFFVVFRVPYLDEGWYVYAGQSVYEGRLPYRDFCYTQSPLLPYLYGLTTIGGGSGLWGGRIVSAVLALAACVVTAATARRHFGEEAALATGLLLAASFHAHGFYGAALTYGSSVFWLSLSFLVAFSEVREPRRTLAALLFAMLAVGVRLSAAAVLPVLVVYLAGRAARPRRHAVWAAGYAGALLVLMFVPFSVGRLDVVIHETLGYHLAGEEESSRVARILGTLGRSALSYGVLIVLALAGVSSAKDRAKLVACAAATGALFVVHFVPATTDPHYFAMLVPTAALGAGYVLVSALAKVSARGGIRCAVLCSAVALHAAGQLWEVRRTRLVSDPRSGSLTPDVGLRKMQVAGKCIAQHMSDRDALLVLNPGLALHARRQVLPGLGMGMFAFRPQWDEATCKRHHVVNWPMLLRMVAHDRPKVVALGGEEMKRLHRADPEAAGTFMRALTGGYTPVREIKGFGQFRESLVVFVQRRQHK